MNTYAVYFWPRGSLASVIDSSTLFGAVCWAIRILELEDMDQLFSNFTPPRFTFSSLFPVYRPSKDILRFYPRPNWLKVSIKDQDLLAAWEKDNHRRLSDKEIQRLVVQNAKKLNEATYVSEGLFSEAVRGELDPPNLYRRSGNQLEQSGTCLIKWEERRQVQPRGKLGSLIESHAIQHNQIDRLASSAAEGMLFYDNEIFFSEGSGFWCALRCTTEDLDQLIRPALRYLADTGLGANRTAGKGHFLIDDPPQILELPQSTGDHDGVLVLSRYMPSEAEATNLKDFRWYSLSTLWAKREARFVSPSGGRTPPLYKRRLRVFEPGSLAPIQPNATGVYGRLVEVVPGDNDGWAVYQSGLAVGVPARLPESRKES